MISPHPALCIASGTGYEGTPKGGSTVTEYQEQEPAAPNNTTRNIIIAVVVIVVLCCCLLAALIFVGPLLLGPTVGNVFSNIIEGLETPIP